jgi:LmbE family N-acetylglucosaminyl deacetylase
MTATDWTETVVAVFAHPDDESLACGGTLARLADSGMHVVVVCASHGEGGSPKSTGADEALGRVRAAELRQAAAALGISEVIILDHPDGNLRWELVTEYRAELEMFLRRRRPAAVITFGEDGLYWHPDHVGIHEQTTTVVRSLGADAPTLYYVTMAPGVMTNIAATARQRGWTLPSQGFWSLAPEAFGFGAQPPSVVVDVAAWVPRKLAAIQCHLSQVGADNPFTQLDEPAARRWLGVEHFHRADVPSSGRPILEQLACASRP